MITHTWGCTIAGIVTAVPKDVVRTADFTQYPEQRRNDVAHAIGVRARGRWSGDLLGLAVPAARRLLAQLLWDSVDVLVVVTQTPVQPAPPTAILLQQALGLKSCAAFDVNLGCSGYPYGLWMLSSLIKPGDRGLLIAGDVCSSYLDPNDPATNMLFGDACSATAVIGVPEFSGRGWKFVLGSDGSGARALRIGETPDGLRLCMEGAEVFSFTLKAVPEMYRQLIGDLRKPDLVALHQANDMIVERLSKKIDAWPARKNVSFRGNTSVASIPLLLCDTGEELRHRDLRTAMLGFGIGWSWSGVLMNLGPVKTLETLEVA